MIHPIRKRVFVVVGIAPEAIVLRPATIEVSIDSVLEQEPHIASWQPVHLEDVTAGLGAAGRAPGHRHTGVVESVVFVAGCAKVRQRCPVLGVVVIGDFALERPQSVGWVARGARAKGRVQVLPFADPVELRGEATTG